MTRGCGTPLVARTLEGAVWYHSLPRLLLRHSPRTFLSLQRALQAAQTAVPHPSITGIIHECVRHRRRSRLLQRLLLPRKRDIAIIPKYKHSPLLHAFPLPRPPRRCGGKLALRDRSWDTSLSEFQAAFKAYEEAGNGPKTILCLKYLLLANVSGVCTPGGGGDVYDAVGRLRGRQGTA